MEESTDVPMETDVSSTTEDVPETQEVTGSHGNVEMTIVVEKVEEDINSRPLIERQTSKDDLSSSDVSGSTIKTSQKDIQIQPPYIKSPTKVSDSSQSPNEPNSSLADVYKQNEPQSSMETQQTGMPDSSSRDSLSSDDETEKNTVNEAAKLVQITPAKVSHENDIAKLGHKTPIKKIETEDTPMKIQTHKTIEVEVAPKSPMKTSEIAQGKSTTMLKLENDAPKSKVGSNTPAKSQAPELIKLKALQKSPMKIVITNNKIHKKSPSKNDLLIDSTKSKTIHISPVKIVQSGDSMKVKPIIISPVKNIPEIVKMNSSQSDSTNQESLGNSTQSKLPQDIMKPTQSLNSSINTPEECPMSLETSPDYSTNKQVQILPQDTQAGELKASEPIQLPIKKVEGIQIEPQNSTNTKEPIIDAKPDEKNEKASLEPAVFEGTPNSEETNTDVDTAVDKEATNDSHTEGNTDGSEKEHNKSISRELKSLIKSAKESKIISECTQLTSKMRKSRSALDSSNTSLNHSVEADKIQGTRRNSNNSQKSGCSEKSEKVTLKRSMRSQNPEFVSKVKQFLNSVTGKVQKDTDEEDSEVEETVSKEKRKKEDDLNVPSPKLKKCEPPPIDTSHEKGKLRSDPYCWRCHWTVEQAPNEKAAPMSCTVCPRSFHFKCLSGVERSKINLEKNWVCPECMLILQAESSDSRSPGMKNISLGMLCDLLKHALDRMMELNGVDPFIKSVDRTLFPDYDKYVVHPMDLTQMKTNIAAGQYGSTEAFIADTQWILHNSIIFNTLQSKLTGAARALVRSCRAEMGEIEACPECYAAANARRPTWFTDVCTTPHILLWAKLKGFPYWPAKGMSVSSSGHVDVRFFGAHDRAWVPAKDCFLYSEKDPNNFRTKRQDILDSMQEAEQHIRNISRKYGKFVYPPFKTQLEPAKLGEQLKMMVPSFEGEVRSLVKDKGTGSSPAAAKEKRRSTSKSSKGSVHDGDVSESDEVPPAKTRKMADGAVIAQVKETTSEKDNGTTDVDTTKSKGKESSRKRRRSELEEAVITIIEPTANSNNTDKRKRIDDDKKEDIKSEPQKSSTKENGDSSKATEKSKDVEMTDAEKKSEDPPKAKDSEPSNTAEKENRRTTPRVTPIRIAFISKDKKRKSSLTRETTAKIVTPNRAKTSSPSTPVAKVVSANKDSPKTPTSSKDGAKTADKEKTPQRQKSNKTDKVPESKLKIALLKDEKTKTEKRRNSRNKSLNGSAQKTEKKEKQNEGGKEKKEPKENGAGKTNGVSNAKAVNVKQASVAVDNAQNSKPVRERLQFDEDMSLAVIARSGMSVQGATSSPMPTISNVVSLSTVGQNKTPTTNTVTNSKTIEITVEANSDSSIFTPTSTSNVKTTNDAVTQLQKLRNETEPVVGRVGVRAFARMTSPDKSPNKNDNVEVEIKAEPIDLDDADRQMEKLDLMNSFRLRPVNPSLRDVRINKVVVTPVPAKKPAKAAETRPRAKKTFPQPKKDDGRSELNGKNSMVYIPIQPPATQSPLRTIRATGPPTIRLTAPVIATTTSSNILTSVQSPLIQVSAVTTSAPASSSQTTITKQSIPMVGQVPTSVHTVPLMTSVNGQWMFSFQPVMSVGGIDNSQTAPVLNGLAERAVPPLITLPTVTSGASPNLQTTVVQAVPPTLQTSVAQIVSKSTEPVQPGEPPRLQQRPPILLLNPLDSNVPVNNVPTPSVAGPVTAKLNQNAAKMTDFFRSLLEDSLESLNDPVTQVVTLTLRLEHETWKNKQTLQEMRHNHDLTIAEMRASFEKEKARIASEVQRKAQTELDEAVKQAKSKQWCANCCQEAQFYCCWNTSYCDYPCQRAHWSQHFSVCTQQRAQSGNENGEPPSSPEHRLQPQPDNLPKSASATTPTPALTAANKMAARATADQSKSAAQKNAAIIVSTVQDTNGGQSVKCVGTYKPPTPATPIILNKQLLNDENTKKMVSSGGYLIVGAAGNNSSVVTPGRRNPTVQYYS